MTVQIIPHKDNWLRAVNAARFTQHKKPIDKEPSSKWKKRALISEHSVIREVMYDIILRDVPYAVVMHLVRHNQGIEKFVATSRPDTTGQPITRHEQRKDDPTDVMFTLNAQAIINISDRRLCNKAEAETRFVWHVVKAEMLHVDPVMYEAMHPRCVYRNGFCGELKPCGYCYTARCTNEIETYAKDSQWEEDMFEQEQY